VRIVVMGTSGSGKTTLARRLAAALGLRRIELDAINWQPDWVALDQTDRPEFVRRVRAAIEGEAWVSDGNYATVRPMLLARATHLVWLDFSRPVVMARVIRRSFVRAVTGDELWPGTGNREQFARWLDKEHPIRWAWDTFHARRARYEAAFADPALAHLSLCRIRSNRDADALLERLTREALPI
jgi:adenylate kinase family enzyme